MQQLSSSAAEQLSSSACQQLKIVSIFSNFAQILENFAQSCNFTTSTFRSSAQQFASLAVQQLSSATLCLHKIGGYYIPNIGDFVTNKVRLTQTCCNM